ncbi:MAG: 3'-5' exonuclease [bacterium]|nr:3'-5' exonuclease [bacterium]
MKIIFLDTETTGLQNGRMIQLAYKERGSSDMFVEYYKPPVPIEFEAMGTHHITEKMVADKKPFSESAVYKKLPGILAESILVAHNAPFDIGILKTEGVETKAFIDTCKVAMALYDFPNYKMQSLRYRWGIEIPATIAHDAAGDVEVLEKVFEHMLKDYMTKEGVNEDEAIQAFVRISAEPLLLKKISFGKHFGKTFDELRETEFSYLEWLAGKLASDGDKDVDLVHTVSFHIKKGKGVREKPTEAPF